ncbi:MAG: hypothetical protein ABEJ07_06725 [Candidatus Nanohaloarchaea archaeon]
MQELLEPVVNNPSVRYVVENPDVAAAGATAAYIAGWSLAGQYGVFRGEKREASKEEENLEQRREELKSDIERESAVRECFNHLLHPVKSGELSELEESSYVPDRDDSEYRFSDEDLERLD